MGVKENGSQRQNRRIAIHSASLHQSNPNSQRSDNHVLHVCMHTQMLWYTQASLPGQVGVTTSMPLIAASVLSPSPVYLLEAGRTEGSFVHAALQMQAVT